MNDAADLNDNIEDHTQQIDKHVGDQKKAAHRIGLDPSRWWFASSAFPMIAGTLGPVASAFSICALIRPWRQHIPPGKNITQADFIPDPHWLTIVNAIQLAIAIVSNVFLLLNMTKRVRFSIAQPITIVGWYISAICLTALNATASGPLIKEPQIEYVWSQAFFYGIYAAILYFVVASLMTVTVWGAQTGHYGKDFNLTPSQRTLMLQTIMFLLYLLIGALVFSSIERWTYLDAVYWADVTLFTIGYGDISPASNLGRGLLIPYALIGIISLGLVIGSIRSLMIDRGKRRLDARMLEKIRRHYLRNIYRTGRERILEPVDDDDDDDASSDNDSDDERRTSRVPKTELERRQREFELMRKIQDKASTRRKWTAMVVSFGTWLVLWLVGAKIFRESEHPYQSWTYFDSFYFCFTGLTTIGYGDLTPVSPAGKSFFVFWSLLALPTMTVLISNAGDTVVKWIKDGTLRLGNITILPAEHGFKKEIKELLNKLTFGTIFKDEEIEQSAPGFLGASQPGHNSDDTGDGEENDDDTDADNSARGPRRKVDNAAKRQSRFTSRVASKLSVMTKDEGASRSRPTTRDMLPRSRVQSVAREEFPLELPELRVEYYLLLIEEITRVTKHLQQNPPRKYTFKEWAWFLRLMGEDESSAETHCKPTKKPTGQITAHIGPHSDPEKDGGICEEKTKWSWVGHRSPLTDPKEEAEWILDRLENKLKLELQAAADERRGDLHPVKEESH